jgi:hypothetical protein
MSFTIDDLPVSDLILKLYVFLCSTCSPLNRNHFDGIMASVLALSAVDCGFEPRSGQTKDYKIGIRCFSSKNAALRRKSKDWLARNQDNVSEWGSTSSTIKLKLNVLV